MRSFAGRDILSLKEFERNEFMHVFDIARQLEPIARSRRNSEMLKEKTLVTAFYQPSTRTRLAHEAAMHRLGGDVTGFFDAKITRAGWGEHPTQILTDLYTILREKGRLDGLTWLAVGDMRMRTMHSLGYALTQFDCPITFVAPPEMGLTPEFKAELKQYSLTFSEAEHVEQAIAKADVILVEPVVQPDYTKSRDERAGDVGQTPANYKITRELLEKKAKPDAVLLHSLPRMDELPPDGDITRWSRYWQEAFNGVVMRPALLALVLGAIEIW